MRTIITVIVAGLFTGISAIYAQNEVDYGNLLPYERDYLTIDTIWIYDWSPDGEWIVAADDDCHLWIIPVNGGESINLAPDDDFYLFPCFSPDGSEVIVTRGQQTFIKGERAIGEKNIEGISLETGERRAVFNDYMWRMWAVYSNNGRFLAYIQSLLSEDEINYQETPALYDIENGTLTFYPEVQQVICFSGGFGIIRFSPDDTEMLITKDLLANDCDKTIGVFRVPVNGSEAEELDLGLGVMLNNPPRYSPDGKWLLYTRKLHHENSFKLKSLDLCVYNIETGKYMNVIPESEYHTQWGVWSPDGSKILYARMSGNEDDPVSGFSANWYIKDFDPSHYTNPVQVSASEPQSFALHGNYPNPFNPITTIDFSLFESGHAALVIYDITGRKVRELVSGTFQTGKHSAVWDGKDDYGTPVSSGAYITRLEVRAKVESQRMILVK